MAQATKVSPYRSIHRLRSGGLHRALGVPAGKQIPQPQIDRAARSSNPHVAQMAGFVGSGGPKESLLGRAGNWISQEASKAASALTPSGWAANELNRVVPRALAGRAPNP